MQSITSDISQRVREARTLFQAEQAQRAERLKQRVALREAEAPKAPVDPTGQRGTKLDMIA